MSNTLVVFLGFIAVIFFSVSFVSFAAIPFDRASEFRMDFGQSRTTDVSTYEEALSGFEDRVNRLKIQRDKNTRGSAHWVDLDKTISELETKVSLAKKDVNILRKATPFTKDAVQISVANQLADIQGAFDRMMAE